MSISAKANSTTYTLAEMSDIPATWSYLYHHPNSSFVTIASFMSEIRALSEAGKTVIPFKVKADSSWAPLGTAAWVRGLIFVQNVGYSNDFGTILATTSSGAYHGHIAYGTSRAVWTVTWKAL